MAELLFYFAQSSCSGFELDFQKSKYIIIKKKSFVLEVKINFGVLQAIY